MVIILETEGAMTKMIMALTFLYSITAFSSKMYQLEMSLFIDGKLASQAKVIVGPEKKGTFTHTDDTEISILAREGEVQGNTGILLDLNIRYKNDDTGRLITSRPQILVHEGKRASFEVVNDSLAQELALELLATSTPS